MFEMPPGINTLKLQVTLCLKICMFPQRICVHILNSLLSDVSRFSLCVVYAAFDSKLDTSEVNFLKLFRDFNLFRLHFHETLFSLADSIEFIVLLGIFGSPCDLCTGLRLIHTAQELELYW